MNKKQQRILWVVIGIIALLIIISSSNLNKTLSVSNLQNKKIIQNVQFAEKGQDITKINPLIITFKPEPFNDVYYLFKNYSIIGITDTQEIWEFCNSLKANIQVRKLDQDIVLDNYGEDLGKRAPTTIESYYEIIPGAIKGDFEVVSEWDCDGRKLGKDGRKDNDETPSIKVFKVVDNIPDTFNYKILLLIGGGALLAYGVYRQYGGRQ